MNCLLTLYYCTDCTVAYLVMDINSSSSSSVPVAMMIQEPARHSYLGDNLRDVRSRLSLIRPPSSLESSVSRWSLSSGGRGRLDQVYDLILIALPDLVLFPGGKQQQLTEEKMYLHLRRNCM